MEALLSVSIGIGLSAACGFRVFAPLLVMSIAAKAGHLTLTPGFGWIATYAALIAFATATILEIAGYYVPWVDNLLDAIATPAAIIAGIVVMASVVREVNPFLKWTLAVIAGGGAAGIVQITTSMTRATSTAVTGGLANLVLSTVEAAASFFLSFVAVVIPFLAAIFVTLIFILAVRKFMQRVSRPTKESAT